MYRHGDVGIFPVEAIPEGAKRDRRRGDLILALGEVTGHAHRIKSPKVAMWSVAGQRYITVSEPAELTHEEHGTITLAPGDYEVVQQREYDYMAEMPRAVAD
jgi:hypothetical protein